MTPKPQSEPEKKKEPEKDHIADSSKMILQPKEPTGAGHCDHKCVCPRYIPVNPFAQCGIIDCEYDTRSRSLPPADAPAQCPNHVEKCLDNCISTSEIHNCERFDCDAYCKLTEQREAAIATAAKAEVLDAFADKILSSVSIPNDPTDGRIPSLGIDELAEIISSLRYTPTTPGTQEREPE